MTHPIVQEALAWLESRVQQGNALTSPDSVRSYLRLRLGPKPHEVFAVVFLNAYHQVIDIAELFRGTLMQISMPYLRNNFLISSEMKSQPLASMRAPC